MALPKVEKDMQIIAKLADEPNSARGDNLDSLTLKQKFDEGGEALKAYINDILLPYLEGVQAAASIGIAAISGMSEATNIQAALEALKSAIDNTATGSIPDGSLSGAKLLAATITSREIAANAIGNDNLQQKAVTADKIADNGIEALNLADNSVAHRHLGALIVEDGNIADKTISGGKIKDNTLTARLFAAGSVSETALRENAVTAEKIADGAVTGAKIAQGAICVGAASFTLSTADWTLNDKGVYEQEKTTTLGVSPEKHIGFLGLTRGLLHYPGDGNSSWGWSQALIAGDREKIACLYSASLIAINTIKFVATEIPDGILYVTILFFRR